MYVWVQQKNSQLFSFLVCVWPLNMKWFAIRINNSRYSTQFHLNEQTMAKHGTQSIHPFDWTRKRVKKQSFLSGLLNCHHFMLCQGFDSTRLLDCNQLFEWALSNYERSRTIQLLALDPRQNAQISTFSKEFFSSSSSLLFLYAF